MMVKKSILALGLMSLVLSGAVALDEFKYKTYGGFWDKPGSWDSAANTSYKGIPLDGPWMREGDFSRIIVPWGDQDNSNKKDPRDPHNLVLDDNNDSWPAISWGRDVHGQPVLDPWAGYDHPPKNGASGIGTSGYGYPKDGSGKTIKLGVAGDLELAPFGSFAHFNNSLNFVGSFEVTVLRNLELYDDTTTPPTLVAKKHYHFKLSQWETYKNSTPCPRSSAETTVNDTTWNSDPSHGITPPLRWINGKAGLGNTFYPDHVQEDEGLCSDPFNFSYIPGSDGDKLDLLLNGKLRDTFTYKDVKYEILLSGIYQNNDAIEGCIVQDIGQDANWSIGCFERHPTLWSVEQQVNVGFVRMEINKLDQGCTPGYWKQPQHLSDWTNPPYTPATDYHSIFGVAAEQFCKAVDKNAYRKLDGLITEKCDGVLSLGEAVWLRGNEAGLSQVVRASTAALLNAANGDIHYPYSIGEIKTMVTNAFAPTATAEDIAKIHKDLDDANNFGNNPVCE